MPNAKPVAEVRIGSIKAAIWKNKAGDTARHNVTFQRLYKDRDRWKATQSFGRHELLALAKVANLAHTRIFELQQTEKD